MAALTASAANAGAALNAVETRYRYIIGSTANASSAAQAASLYKVGGTVPMYAATASATASASATSTRYSYKVGGTANATAGLQPLYLTPSTAASAGVASAGATASATDLWQREYVENANATASASAAELSKNRHLMFDAASATAGMNAASLGRKSQITASPSAASASASIALLAIHPSVVLFTAPFGATATASLASLTNTSERVTYSVAAANADATASSTASLSKNNDPLAADATAAASEPVLYRLAQLEFTPADATAGSSGDLFDTHALSLAVASATAVARTAYVSCPILFTANANALATANRAHLRRLLRSGKVKHTSNLRSGTLSAADLTVKRAPTKTPESQELDTRRTRVGGGTWQSV